MRSPQTAAADPSSKRNGAGFFRNLLMAAVCVLTFDSLRQLTNQQQDNTTDTTSTATTIASHKDHAFCPDATKFFPLQELEAALEQNLDFHARGGNLKSIQDFLTAHIESTVQTNDLVFQPKDKNTPDTPNVKQHLQQYWKDHPDPRGGYGTPLPGKYSQPKHPVLLEGRYVNVQEPQGRPDGKLRWDASLGPIGPTCDNMWRIGPPGNQDGTKYMCHPQQAPKQFNHTTTSVLDSNNNQDCHIISIGGNDNWLTEIGVMKSMPGCTTHTFDCTLKDGIPRKKPKEYSNHMHFYNHCIDHTSYTDEHGRSFKTYFEILQIAGLAAPPRLFKMDVEGFEFDIYTSMIQLAGQYNSNTDNDISRSLKSPTPQPLSWWLPQQIATELHYATRMTGVSWMLRTKTAAEIALLTATMFNGGGYVPIHLDYTPYCPSCMEVLYFRVVC